MKRLFVFASILAFGLVHLHAEDVKPLKVLQICGGCCHDYEKQKLILAEGISEAMNCTAFGLIVAIIGLIGFAILNNKTQSLEDDINEASVQVLNLVVTNRQKVNLTGVAA